MNTIGPLIPDPLVPGVVLQRENILKLVENGLLFQKATFDDRHLDSCSYDVCIGAKAVLGGIGQEIDLRKQPLEISPGCYAAVISQEFVKLPADIIARINAKRSMSYLGLALLTGAQIDPGYEGHLLFGFYNASSRKVVLRSGRAICSLVFESLAAAVSRPKQSDPDLVRGDFPEAFINEMANMEVLSLQQLSEQIKELDRISRDIIDLRSKYDNVLQPIKELTSNVSRLSEDVDKLRDNQSQLQTIANQNAQTVSQLSAVVQSVSTGIQKLMVDNESLRKCTEDHEAVLKLLGNKYSRFYAVVYVLGAILLLIIGGVITHFIPKLF